MLARWLHTGELFGVVGQTIAALATLCGVLAAVAPARRAAALDPAQAIRA